MTPKKPIKSRAELEEEFTNAINKIDAEIASFNIKHKQAEAAFMAKCENKKRKVEQKYLPLIEASGNPGSTPFTSSIPGTGHLGDY